MKSRSFRWIAVFLIISGCLLLAGCGGGGDDDGSQATTTSQTQTSTAARQVIERVLEILIGDTGTTQTQGQTPTARSGVITDVHTRQQSVSVTVECSVGQVSFTGEADSQPTDGAENFMISGTFNFNNCEGIDGTLSLFSSGTITDTEIDLSLTLDGDISAEGCTITFLEFSVITAADSSGSLTEPILTNGGLDAACDGDSIACTFNNTDLENREAFKNSCQAA